MRIKALCAALMALIFTPAAANAETILSICRLKEGPWKLVTDVSPIETWETCVVNIPVVTRVFNTTNLTANRPVEFDPLTKTFFPIASAEIRETTLPGSDLLVLDLAFDLDRTMVFSLSANRFFASDLSDIEGKLIDEGKFRTLQKMAGGRNPYIVAIANTPFYTGQNIDLKTDIGKGRIGSLAATFPDHKDGELTHFTCLTGGCPAKTGWVPAQNLVEMKRVKLVRGALPVVLQRSAWEAIKDCGSETTNTSTIQFRQKVEAGLEVERVLGAKFNALIEQLIEVVQDEKYPVDTEIEWSSFLVLNYEIGSERVKRQKQPIWKRALHYVVLVEKKTTNCKEDPKFKFYIGKLSGQRAKVLDLSQDVPPIRNIKEQLKFVRVADLRFKENQLPRWLIEHISSAISLYQPEVR